MIREINNSSINPLSAILQSASFICANLCLNCSTLSGQFCVKPSEAKQSPPFLFLICLNLPKRRSRPILQFRIH